MAERQSGESDLDDAEKERFSKKLDGYEAMGLEVKALRELLDEDVDKFKDSYLREIRAQLEGGPEKTEEVEPVPEEEPEISPEEEEAIAEEEAEEELELELEGSGPEAALLAVGETEEIEEEAAEVTPDEDIRISFGDQDETDVEVAPPADEAVEEEEPTEEDEVVVEEATEEDGVAVVEEAPGEEEVVEDEEVPEEEGKAPSVIETEEEIEKEPAAEADEAEIQVAPEETEEETEEEEAAPEDYKEVEDEEALIVVASVIEETEEEPVAEEETEILLSGISPEGEAEEEPVEEVIEDLEEEAAEEEAGAPPPKKVRPRPVAAAKPEPTAKPKTKPAAKAETPAKAKVKPAPATVKRRRRLSTGVIAVIMVAILVMAGIGAYFVYFQNQDPVALFTWDPEEPTVGESVGFNAGASYDPDGDTITEYRWAFGDGATAKGRSVEHSFLSSETFTVTLTVKDSKGGQSSVPRKVTVEPLTVTMEQPSVGDFFDYGVSGSAKLFNYAEGLLTFEARGQVYKVYEVDATDISGTKTLEVIQMGTAVDGFMVTHDVRTERTMYDLDDISGNISTEAAVNPAFTGSMEATVVDDICLEWERSIRNTVTLEAAFSASLWADLTTSDNGVFYGQLNDIEDTFSLNEFLRNTDFVSDDPEKHRMPVGDDAYYWQVLGMERVHGRDKPSIVIRVTMDEDTLAASNLVSFFTDVWIEPGLSWPAKSHAYTKGRQEGNQFEVNLTETLSTFNAGSDPATGTCSGDHAFSQKEENPGSFLDLNRVPDQGGTGDYFKFSPREALVTARTDIPDLNNWMNNYPNAFLHLGNYTEIGTDGRWVMAFGDKDLSEHYEVEAIGSSVLALSTDADPYTDNKLPLSSQSEIGEVVTLTHGLRLMRAEPNIRNRCFDDQTPDWTRFTFNVTEGVNVLSLDPGSALSGSQATGYVYLLVSKQHNPEYKAALDATNGQILFSWTHSYTFDPFN